MHQIKGLIWCPLATFKNPPKRMESEVFDIRKRESIIDYMYGPCWSNGLILSAFKIGLWQHGVSKVIFAKNISTRGIFQNNSPMYIWWSIFGKHAYVLEFFVGEKHILQTAQMFVKAWIHAQDCSFEAASCQSIGHCGSGPASWHDKPPPTSPELINQTIHSSLLG